MTDTVLRMLEAAAVANGLECVDVQMTFDKDSVGYTMHSRRVMRTGPSYEIGHMVTWEELRLMSLNPLVFHLRADHQALLARMEGPKSTNPNREHPHSYVVAN